MYGRAAVIGRTRKAAPARIAADHDSRSDREAGANGNSENSTAAGRAPFARVARAGRSVQEAAPLVEAAHARIGEQRPVDLQDVRSAVRVALEQADPVLRHDDVPAD